MTLIKKFNWGHGIALFIALFILTMCSMVYYSFQQTNEMIDDNYYQKEVEYQQLIDARQSLNERLKGQSMILDSGDKVYFKFPLTTFEHNPQGAIELIKVDNEKMDVNVPILVNPEGIQEISKDKLNKGTYRARIKWTHLTDTFYHDKIFLVYK